MTWREALDAVLPPDQAAGVAESVDIRWQGARLYLPMRAARFHWRLSQPFGAGETFADEMRMQILLRGGTVENARAVLLPLVGRHFVV